MIIYKLCSSVPALINAPALVPEGLKWSEFTPRPLKNIKLCHLLVQLKRETFFFSFSHFVLERAQALLKVRFVEGQVWAQLSAGAD